MTTLLKQAAIKHQNQKFAKKITQNIYLPIDYFPAPKRRSATNLIAPKLMAKTYK